MSLRRAARPLEIRCARIESPLGPIYAAASDRGVCRISLTKAEEEDFLDDVRRRTGAEPVMRRSALALLERELRAYFSGRLRRFTTPLDLTGLTTFQRSVLRETARIPFGRTATYGEIASRIRRPGASRAVGGALGSNPVPIVVPCHRVVASGGAIGGFTGGLSLKRALLEVEGIRGL